MTLRRSVIGAVWMVFLLLLATPHTQAFQFLGVEQEIRVGQDVARQLEAEYGLYQAEPELLEHISQIGMALAKHSARPSLPYSFQILDTDDINALAAPGGYVYLYRGLLDVLDDDH